MLKKLTFKMVKTHFYKKATKPNYRYKLKKSYP